MKIKKTKAEILRERRGFSDIIYQLYKYYPEETLDVQTITFQVTESCNLNCSYCYQHNKTNKKMSFEVAKDFIDLLLSDSDKIKKYNTNKKSGVVIDFIGGEPLLEIDLIDEITNYFITQLIILDHPWKTRYRISIGTNGMLYFNEKVQKYINKHKYHLSLAITLDGNKELHDMCRKDLNGNPSYDQVVKAVKHYQENYNSNLSTKLTVAPENIDFLFDGVKNFIDLNFHTIFFNPVFEDVWNDSDATKYYYQLKKLADFLIDNNLQDEIYISALDSTGSGYKDLDDRNWCGGTGKMISVNHSGNIYPCLRYMESSLGNNQKPFIIGDVKNGVGYTEEQINRIDLLKSITKTSQSSEKCLNCPISAGCAWCSAYNYEIFGTPNKRATFICKMHQARILAIKYFENLKNNSYQLNIPEEWALEIIPIEEYKLLNKGE